jgi:hypothetical protein
VTWTKPCDTGSCLEVDDTGDQVQLRQSDHPDVVVTLSRAEWDAHLDEVRAQGYAQAVARLRNGDRFVTWAFKTKPDVGIISDVCADYLEQTKETP